MNKANKEKFDKEIIALKKLKGKERLADMRFIVDYIKIKEGEAAFKKLEKYLRDQYNFSIPKFEKDPDTAWISEVSPHIIAVAAIRFFNWNKEDITKMGKDALSLSRTLTLFVKYFISIKQTMQKIVNEWNNYYTEGQMTLVNFNDDKREATLILNDFKTHPLMCLYLIGIMERILELASGSKNIKIEETKCMFKGADYHEFKVKW